VQGHVGIVHVVEVFENRIFSGSADKTIKVWNIETFQEVKTLDTHENTVCALAIGCGYLFAGSYAAVKVWNIETYELVRRLEGHNHWVRALSVRNGYLYSGAYNTVKASAELLWLTDCFQEMERGNTRARSRFQRA
jgi:WD40 repeat protein